MSSAVLDSPQPLVLIVEDQPPSLRSRLDLFESFGCTALGVSSMKDAIRQLAANPLVDLLVTDIHMSVSEANDKSGVELAQYVRQSWEGLPIAGYSAHFSEHDLSDEELRVFDLAFAKGRLRSKDIEAQVEACVALATDHRERRAAEYDDTLARLRREQESGLPPPDLLEEFERRGGVGVSPAGALKKAGYRLERVVPESGLPIREPFVVWLLSTRDGWECEVYGYPDLYAVGPTVDKAIGLLAELMVLFRLDLEADAAPSSPQVERLGEFLGRVLLSQSAT